MKPNQFFDEYLCWRAEVLGVSRQDGVLISEYIRVEFIAVKSYKRKSRETPVHFSHLESEDEFPMAMVPVIEELIAENLFQLWLQQHIREGKDIGRNSWVS